jgi:hypothetical protein
LADSKFKAYHKLIIQKADKRLVKAICEIVYNLLNKNLQISQSEKHKLLKYRKSLIKLCDRNSLVTKKKILIQQGGFLQLILPALIGGLAQIISSAISNHSSEE